ncbi:MAG: HEAT repeat domain-containing protein, partial [Planctomycetota bacterium]
VIAAGAPPVQMIPYQPNGQPLGAPPTAHMFTPPQAPQLFPTNPSNVAVGSRYPTQGMANAFTPVPNQRPIPSDVESTIVMQNAFNPPMPKEGEMPAQGLTQPVNPNTIVAQSVGYGQLPANMMAYIQPQYTAAPVDMVLTENVQTLKNANQPSQREYAADQLSKIRGVSMNQAVIALATAIKEDPAPLVRAACIRSLTRMKINTIEVLEVINEKKTDLDPRVRMEADQALIQLTSGSSESGNRIHQTGSNYKK